MLNPKLGAAALVVVLMTIGLTIIGGAAYAQPLLASSNQMAVAQPTKDPCRDDQGVEICPFFIAFDGRINYTDPLASITGYCQRDSSIQVYSIVNSVGTYLGTASRADLINGLAGAIGSRAARVVFDAQGMQIIALPTGQLRLADNRTGSGYGYTFSPSICNLPTPAGSVSAATPKPGNSVNTGNPPVPPAPNIVIPAVSPSRTEAHARIALNLRGRPAGRRIGGIPKGGVMTLLARDTSNYWMKVQYGGLTGWVASIYTNVQVAAFRALPVE